MADLGKVVITDGANYSASVTYEKLTFVHYQGDAYMTLKTVKGVTPTDDGVNYRLFCKSAELATTSKAGIVLPDGTTTTVDSSGKLSVKKATTSLAGIVKPAATDFTVATDGTQKINTQFTQATTLANIIAGEAIASVLGKVSKAIATTMSLDQNALLKNMLTSIDGNSSEKVPTQAYIHTLVERIGMGTELTAGANLTEVANELSSNLADKLLIKNTTLWSGKNYADDYRAESMIFYCNPVQGNLTAYNFPVNETGVFKSIVCNQFVSQTYITINNALYQRIAADSSSPFSAWELK